MGKAGVSLITTQADGEWQTPSLRFHILLQRKIHFNFLRQEAALHEQIRGHTRPNGLIDKVVREH